MTETLAEDSRWGCAVCGRILEEYLEQGITVRVDHPFDLLPTTDHPVVPVPVGEIPQQLLARCDFCLAEPPTHTLISVETELPSAQMLYDDEWAVCAKCAAFLEVDDWLGLRRRAFAAFRLKHGDLSEQVAMEMRVVFNSLRKGLRSFTRDD